MGYKGTGNLRFSIFLYAIEYTFGEKTAMPVIFVESLSLIDGPQRREKSSSALGKITPKAF